jgi:predicted transcriptional regulator
LEKPDVYVVARFLEIMYHNGSSMKKTNIHTLLGIRYPRFTEYLEWLLKHEFVAEGLDEEEAKTIVLTPHGLDTYNKLVILIKETFDIAEI